MIQGRSQETENRSEELLFSNSPLLPTLPHLQYGTSVQGMQGKKELMKSYFLTELHLYSPCSRSCLPQQIDVLTERYCLHPLLLWVGIGCNRGISRQMIETAIEQVFRENQLAESAIAGIATIDMKIGEVGLRELCQERNFQLLTFSAEILRSICVPNPSKAIEKEVGTFSVAEAAALCAAQCQNLLVPKQIFRSSNPNQKGAVTLAIAQQFPDVCTQQQFKFIP